MKLFVSILLGMAIYAFAQSSAWDRPIYSDSGESSKAEISSETSVPQKQSSMEQVIFVQRKGKFESIPVSAYFAVDSVPIYDMKIEQAESSHESLSGFGTIFLLSGAFALDRKSVV